MLVGLLDGVTYQVGVRAFNASGEESNTRAVSVAGSSVAPAAVAGLSGAEARALIRAGRWRQTTAGMAVVLAVALTADVLDRDAMSRAFDAVEAEFGTVTVLINNAGIAHAGRAVEMPECPARSRHRCGPSYAPVCHPETCAPARTARRAAAPVVPSPADRPDA